MTASKKRSWCHWTLAKGRLVEINKCHQTLTLETTRKHEGIEHCKRTTYRIASNWASEKDYEELMHLVNKIISFELIDGEAFMWEEVE